MNKIEIFKTDIQNHTEAQHVLAALQVELPSSIINFDLDDVEKVLRVENPPPDLNVIIRVLEKKGFLCRVIPDKVCSPSDNPSKHMKDFWETSFQSYQVMWGLKPCQSAINALEIFAEKQINSILIPGIGYGRNAQYFIENGMTVTGIEISSMAISLARQYYHMNCEIFNGSVTDMPFNDQLYDGIFCYAILHLLNKSQRKKMISDCYNQLTKGGLMIFSVVSKNSSNYGKGKKIAEDTFEIGAGAQIFFYDFETVRKDFQDYGLTSFIEIEEPNTAASNASFSRFILIACEKN